MKVICIDDKWENMPGSYINKSPAFGEIVTVSSEFKDHFSEWFTFHEYGPHSEYEQCGFAPLSDIDETTFERNLIGQMDHNYRW